MKQLTLLLGLTLDPNNQDMTNTLLSELLKISVVTGLLAYIAYILWKRFDTRVKEMGAELKELRARYETEILQDRATFAVLIRDNNEAVHEVKDAVNSFKTSVESITKTNQSVLSRCTHIMECLTKEIQKIKPEALASKG